MIKAVIIDDERLARKRVSELLGQHLDKIQLIGEADNGTKAIALIEAEKPELIFLDIQMPDMSGFTMLEHLSYQPRIIFTTAYQEYAIDAFEKMSIDYLIKPLHQDRFNKAIDKLLTLDANIKLEEMHQLFNMIKHQAAQKPSSSLPIKKDNKIILVDYEDIAYFEAADKYVNVWLANGKTHLSDKTLTQLENMAPDTFIRIHRSYFVNKDYISEIEKYFKGTLILTMNDKQRSTLKTGETYAKKVRLALGL